MKVTEPRFSVVIPVKDGERYIAEAINSVLAQTYQNFELIILDNFSADGTMDILNSYQDSRVTIFHAEKSLPIEQNWARVLSLELNEYLTILGHDDIFYPDFLVEISRLILEDSNASLYQTHFDLIDEEGGIIRTCKPIPFRETADQFLFARHKHQRDSFGTGYVMRAADYRNVGGLPVELPYLIGADDIALYNLSNLSYKVCSPHSQFAYRYHKRSASRSMRLHALNEAFQKYLELLEQTEYFNNDAHRRIANKFLRGSFTGLHRRILMDLVLEADASRWKEYWTTKRCLILEVEKSPFIKLRAPSLLTLELIRFLPGTMKRPLIHLIERLGETIQKLKYAVDLSEGNLTNKSLRTGM